MKALMGEQPLTVRTIFDRLRTVHADGEVVDALPGGSSRTGSRRRRRRRTC